MSVNQMPVDQMSVNQMSVDQKSVDQPRHVVVCKRTSLSQAAVNYKRRDLYQIGNKNEEDLPTRHQPVDPNLWSKPVQKPV